MNKIRLLTVSAIVLGFLSLGWLICDLSAYIYLSSNILVWKGAGTRAEVLGLMVGAGLLVLFLFHVIALSTIILQLYHEKSTGLLKALGLFAGSISLLLLFSDFAMMRDVYVQSRVGWSSTGEWTILYVNLAFHLLFLLLSIRINLSFLKRLKAADTAEPVLKDEALFLTAQYIGIACGALGLSMVGLGYGYELPGGVLLVVSAVVLTPYGLIVACWLLEKYRERPVEWYDEKQFTDIARAGFFTLLLSLPCMAVVFLLDSLGILVNLNVLWFFIYIFLILGFFSGGTLYFSTRQ